MGRIIKLLHFVNLARKELTLIRMESIFYDMAAIILNMAGYAYIDVPHRHDSCHGDSEDDPGGVNREGPSEFR